MKIRIFVGTGGVGKTSVAAASALRWAIDGKRCLVLTIDPALRLKTALGMNSTVAEQKVPLESGSVAGELWAALLDVRAIMDQLVRTHANEQQAQTILAHPIYQLLITSLPGMNELVAIERIHQATEQGFDTIFIDTAPSRHAFEFLDKPEFFIQLVTFPIVKLVGRTYKWWEQSAWARAGHKSFALYSHIEDLLGAAVVRQILEFFSVFQPIAEEYARRAKRTISILRDPHSTSFIVVTTPSKSKRDSEYLWTELTKRKFFVEELVVNRIWPTLQIKLSPKPSPVLGSVVTWYESVSIFQRRTWDEISAHWAGKIPRLTGLYELPRDIDGIAALREIAVQMQAAARKDS